MRKVRRRSVKGARSLCTDVARRRNAGLCHIEVGPKWSEVRSGRLEIARRLLAAFGDDFVADLLAFDERAHSGALDRADVNEHIVAAVVRLNESKALLAVKPLHSTCRHFLLQSAYAQVPRARHAEQILFVDVYGKGARGRIQQGTAAERTASTYTSSSPFARLDGI